MITESFDDKSEAIITPASFYGEPQKLCDIAIATYSREIYPMVLDMFAHEQIGEMRSVNRLKPIHMLDVDGIKIAFYLSELGSAFSATDVLEVNHKTGAGHFVIFGSAGALDNELTRDKYLIPTESYRDEGMSYHYAPPADYIKISNAETMAQLFEGLKVPYVKGRIWTTDAIYRETRNSVAARKAEGCIAVDMEAAGLQAVCDFHGIELYNFLVIGDVVDQTDYTPEGLHDANHSLDKFYIALKIAKWIKTHRL